MAHAPAHTADEAIDDSIPPEMDYAMHERTYHGFVTGLKWVIGLTAVVMVALYFIVKP